MVAHLDGGDVGADRLDDACALVAEHDRHRVGERAFDDLEVGMAQPRRHDAHQHIVRRQLPDRQAADLERPADAGQDRGVELDHAQSRSSPFMPAFLRAFLASSVRILPAW